MNIFGVQQNKFLCVLIITVYTMILMLIWKNTKILDSTMIILLIFGVILCFTLFL